MTNVLKRTEIRKCKKHGETIHTFRDNWWRCNKCSVEHVQKRRFVLKEKAVQYKGGKCQCCGYNKYLGALEFHHIQPSEKNFGISSKGYTKSWEKVKNELDKCILVCSNCHKEIHANIIACPTEMIKNDISFENKKEIVKENKSHKIPSESDIIKVFQNECSFSSVG